VKGRFEVLPIRLSSWREAVHSKAPFITNA
jgi:hypothetical protein